MSIEHDIQQERADARAERVERIRDAYTAEQATEIITDHIGDVAEPKVLQLLGELATCAPCAFPGIAKKIETELDRLLTEAAEREVGR